MGLIVAIWAPWFYAEIARQADSSLRGRPVLVISGRRPSGRVIGLSPEAAACGVKEGTAWRQAYRACGDAALVDYRREDYQPYTARMGALLHGFTPWVEPFPCAGNEFFAGMGSLCMENCLEIARQAQTKLLDELGLCSRSGVAAGRLAARCAAIQAAARAGCSSDPGEPLPAPQGKERRFLASLPVASLWELRPDQLRRLELLGLRTLGDLARQSPRGLAAPLGPLACHYIQLARGVDRRAVAAWIPDPEERDCCRIEVEEPSRIYLEHLLRSLVGRLTARLARRGSTARSIAVTLYLAGGGRITSVRALKKAGSLPEPFFLNACCLLDSLLQRLTADSSPPRLIEVSLSRLHEETSLQLCLFDGADRSQLLGRVVARLQDRFGSRRIFTGKHKVNEWPGATSPRSK